MTMRLFSHIEDSIDAPKSKKIDITDLTVDYRPEFKMGQFLKNAIYRHGSF